MKSQNTVLKQGVAQIWNSEKLRGTGWIYYLVDRGVHPRRSWSPNCAIFVPNCETLQDAYLYDSMILESAGFSENLALIQNTLDPPLCEYVGAPPFSWDFVALRSIDRET